MAAAALVGEKVLQLVAIAAANIVILRSLGPIQAGYLSAATALFAMALPLTSFGAVPIIGAISRTWSRALERQFVAQAVVYSAAAAGVAAIVLMAVGSSIPGPLGSLVLILGIALLSRPLWAVDVWYQAKHQNATAAGIRTIGILFSAAFRIFIAVTSGRLELLAWALVAEHVVIGFALAAVYVRRRGAFRFGRLSEDKRRDIWRVSWPLLLSGMAVILYMRIDQPMILWLSTSSQVSFYAAAANLNDALSFLPTVAFTLIYPILVRLFESNSEVFFELCQKVFSCAAAISYTVFFLGVAVAPILIFALYGAAYSPAAELLQILLFGLPFVFLGVLQTPWILTHGLQRYSLLNAYLALGINVSLNFFFIPLYGAAGAAVTTVIAHAIGGPLGNVFYAKTRPIFKQQLRALNPIYSFRIAFGLLAHIAKWRR